MVYLMLDITDKYDYDIHENMVCSKLKALQEQIANYLLLDGVYLEFTIHEGSFLNGTLCVKSTDIVTHYAKRNGIEVPIMEVKS